MLCKFFLSQILRLFCSVLIPWSRFDLYIEDNSSTQSRPTYGSPVLLDSPKQIHTMNYKIMIIRSPTAIDHFMVFITLQ